MTLSEYKEKGILEAYVLGVLDPETTGQLESDLETNIALKEELEKVESTLSNFKRNFTKGQQKKRTATPKRQKKTARSKSEKSIRIILGVLILVMVVMIFLFLSTIYENNNFRKGLIGQAETIDSLKNEIQNTTDINMAIKAGMVDLTRDAASVVILSGIGKFSEEKAYLVAPESKFSKDFLVLNQITTSDEDTYLQLWSESAGQFRRVGRVDIAKSQEGWIVHPLPRTNLQLSHISIESGTPPSSPIQENLVFVLN